MSFSSPFRLLGQRGSPSPSPRSSGGGVLRTRNAAGIVGAALAAAAPSSLKKAGKAVGKAAGKAAAKASRAVPKRAAKTAAKFVGQTRTYNKPGKGMAKSPVKRDAQGRSLAVKAARKSEYHRPDTASGAALHNEAIKAAGLQFGQQIAAALADPVLGEHMAFVSTVINGVPYGGFTCTHICETANDCGQEDYEVVNAKCKSGKTTLKGASNFLKLLRGKGCGKGSEWIEHRDNPRTGARLVDGNRYTFYHKNFWPDRPDLIDTIKGGTGKFYHDD